MIQYSRRAATDLTRHGICLAARHGSNTLHEYMISRSSKNSSQNEKKFLQLVLAEQFVNDWKKTDLSIVQGLIDYGVDITLPLQHQDPNFLLLNLLKSSSRSKPDENLEELVLLLVSGGAVIDEYLLTEAVFRDLGRKDLSPLLPSFLAHVSPRDMSQMGARALTVAIQGGNFELISLLLGKGTEINADVFDLLVQKSYSILASAIRSPKGTEVEMIKFLIHRGADIRINQQTPDPLSFLEYSVKELDTGPEFLYQIETITDIAKVDLGQASGMLLECCLQNPLTHRTSGKSGNQKIGAL